MAMDSAQNAGNQVSDVSRRVLPTWLFVAYGGGHMAMVVPVALRVKQLGLAEPIVLGLTTGFSVARAAGLRTLGFKDFVRPVVDDRALEHGKRLLSTLPSPALDEAEGAAYLGLSYADLVLELGESAAAQAYRENGRQVFNPVPTLARIVETLGPQLVVTTNSPRAERAAIRAAVQIGLPTVCMVDLFALDEVGWIGQPGFANRVCVLSESVRTLLVGAGRAESEVVVTGNPAFDRLFDGDHAAQAQAIRNAHMGPGQTQLVLFASSAEPASHPWYPGQTGDPAMGLKITALLSEFALSHPDVAVMVKPHPSQAATFPSQVGHVRTCSTEWPLTALLHACDAVVVITSTVAVEASLLGKPVIRVWGSLFDAASPFEALGFASASVHMPQLQAALQGLLAQPARPAAQFVAPHATQKVVDVLASVADN